MEKIKLVLIALQPMLWWVIYSALYPMAKRINNETGLSFVCCISAFAVMMILTISIAYKRMDDN